MSHVEPKSLADADTLLGMLQRGRGAGYLLAIETAPSTVWPLLFECITNDPRLDRQVEDRADYYASLILETEMDITPLADYLQKNDGPGELYWKVTLTIETLDSLVCRHHMKALHILQNYISYGSYWQDAVRYLWFSQVDGALDGVDRTICNRLSEDQSFCEDFESSIVDDLQMYCTSDKDLDVGPLLPVCEPWKSLCQKNERLAQAFHQFCPPNAIKSPGRKKHEVFPDLTELSTRELFAIMDRPDGPRFYKIARALEQKVSLDDEKLLLTNLSDENEYRIMLALTGLGELGTHKAFEAIKSIIEFTKEPHSRVRAQAIKSLVRIPASLSLETGRQWFQKDEWYFQVGGGAILANHATLDDIPLLVKALNTLQTIECKDFRLSNALEAFWRFDCVGHIPEIENVFIVVPHSYHRWRAAYAMATTAPDVFQAHYAYECLWDCHDDTRICGCENASLSQPGVLARLNEISEDPNEDDEVRAAAKLVINEF